VFFFFFFSKIQNRFYYKNSLITNSQIARLVFVVKALISAACLVYLQYNRGSEGRG